MAKRRTTTQWPKEGQQHNGQKKDNNTMAKRKSTKRPTTI
jgi:hypothetical protein